LLNSCVYLAFTIRRWGSPRKVSKIISRCTPSQRRGTAALDRGAETSQGKVIHHQFGGQISHRDGNERLAHWMLCHRFIWEVLIPEVLILWTLNFTPGVLKPLPM
jgi:hypothetical protein